MKDYQSQGRVKNFSISRLIPYLQEFKADIAIVMVALLVVSASLLSLGTSFKKLVDHGLGSHKIAEINHAVLLICFSIVTFSVSSFFRSYFINQVSEKLVNKIRLNAYRALLRKEVVYFEQLKIGDLISRLTADLDTTARLVTDFLSFFIRNSLMLIGGVGLMFLQSYKLSLIVVFIIPVLLFPLLKFAKMLRQLSKDTMQVKAGLASDIAETFGNIKTIYSFNKQDDNLTAFADRSDNYLRHVARRLKVRSLFFASSIFTILSSITLVIWLGSVDIAYGDMSSGQMVSFIYYAVVAGMSGGGIAELISEIQVPLAALDRVMNLIENDERGKIIHESINEPNHIEKSYLFSSLERGIAFEKVNFAYPSRPDSKIFEDLSLQFKLGSFTAIVGKSGSGKSTIAQLLLKFYQPSSGVISVNNHNIDMMSDCDLRRIIACVPQEPSIFSGTIKSNIIFVRPDCSEEELLAVIKATGIDEFTRALPEKLDTLVGEKGMRLSGGQKQRIAIARALLYKPEILLLDEATSALDSKSEQIIFENIQKIMQGKTIISIAHRIFSIENADLIMLIDQGRLIDAGNHNQLLIKSQLYRTLCEEQFIKGVYSANFSN